MPRSISNPLRYFAGTQPTIFVLVWCFAEASQPLNIGISRIGYDWATYVVVMMAAIWTISVVPTAYLVEHFSRHRLSETNLRRLLVASCAAVSYLSTFLFAAPIAITPFGFALAAGGAVYGALFKTAADMLQARG